MTTPVTQTFSVRVEEITEGFAPELREQARQLLLEYGRFIMAHPHASRFCFGSLQAEAENLPASYRDIGGGCLLALVNDRSAGFVGWRPAPGFHAANSWEMRRLWVRPEARGLGLGRQLTQAVLDRAVAAHRKTVCLETIPAAMPDALQLYLKMGFECDPFPQEPVEHIEYLVKYL